MVRKLSWALLGLVVALLVLPPLWYTAFPPPDPPPLPPPGRRVELPSGITLNVVEEGEGPPLVLVHGLPGTAYDWRVLQAELAKRGFRVLAYDRAGYGRSAARPEGAAHSISANVDDLETFLEVMSLDDATVVGWSYGGATALAAASEGSERMKRMVLVGTAGPTSPQAEPPDEPPAFIRFLYSDPVLAWRARVPPFTRALMVGATDAAFSGRPYPDWWLPSVEANFSRPETVATYKAEMFQPIDADGFAPDRIDVPTLLIHGGDDRLVPVAVSQYLSTAIPDARAEIVLEGSHMLPITHAPLLADSIEAFVRAN